MYTYWNVLFKLFFSSWKEQDIFVDSLLAKLENSAAEEVVKYANKITPFPLFYLPLYNLPSNVSLPPSYLSLPVFFPLCPNPPSLRLKESEARLQSQVQELTRRENVLNMRLATKQEEVRNILVSLPRPRTLINLPIPTQLLCM